MRVAVTGATGFTGRFVLDALNRRGVECVPLSVDLTDRDAVEDAISEIKFDRVVHLAARAFVDVADWQSFYSVNQLGTYNLLGAVADHRPGARCVLASSAQVYGPGAEGLVAEDTIPHPANHYAISKLGMEQGAALWRDRLDIVVTRPFNYTGIGQSIDYLVPKIVDHFRRRAPEIQLGNLFVKRDFGDVRAVAAAYAGLVTTTSVPSVVNIATGTLHSIGDIIERLTRLSGHHIDVQVNPRFVRANDVAVLGGTPALLSRTLPDWSPYALADTLAWMYGADLA